MPHYLSGSWIGGAAIPELEVEEIAAPTLAPAIVLVDYYRSLWRDEGMPCRTDVDPLTIPRTVLASVYLLEPSENYDDWTYRLIGTEIVERFRVDRTGQNLRRFLPEDQAGRLIENSNRTVAGKVARFFRLRPHGTAMHGFYAETMSLPVEDKKTGKIWLFGGTFFGGVQLD